MASVAQVQANRSNAQKSTGPRTPQGKATASRNAVKHGLLAEQVVIHGEDPAEFNRYREGMLAELGPVGAVEEMLAERAVSLAWRLRRAERLQSAVFATVYRENANDVVLWPKHGLPIQPGPDEDEVVLGQVVMTDFARPQVLDRLLVYERRIESSLYRTMAQLRREREARATAEAEGVLRAEQRPGEKPGREATEVTERHREKRGGQGKNAASCEPLVSSLNSCPPGSVPSVGSVAKTAFSVLERIIDSASGLPAGPEPATPELGSFGADGAEEVLSLKCQVSSGGGGEARFVPRLRGGVSSSGGVGRASAPRSTSAATDTSLATATVYPATAGNHGQDAHATETPDGVPTNAAAGNHGRDARATGTLHASPCTLHDPSCETKPIEESVKFEVSSFK